MKKWSYCILFSVSNVIPFLYFNVFNLYLNILFSLVTNKYRYLEMTATSEHPFFVYIGLPSCFPDGTDILCNPFECATNAMRGRDLVDMYATLVSTINTQSNDNFVQMMKI